MTCECLLGIPALHNMSAVIDCQAGLMDFEDDNGEVQIFGKNRSKITDLVGYVDSVVEYRKRRSRDKPGTTKSRKKGKTKGIPAPAKGRREGNVWIAAENDSFNRIIVALGLRESGQLTPLNCSSSTSSSSTSSSSTSSSSTSSTSTCDDML